MTTDARASALTRRRFLGQAFAATAAGLLVPEWLLDPPKGRSMVAVPERWFAGWAENFAIDENLVIHWVGTPAGLSSVKEFYNWLTDWSEEVDNLTYSMPAVRITDELIELSKEYSVDGEVWSHLHSGTVKHGCGKYDDIFW